MNGHSEHAPTSRSVATPANPTNLPSRYEIRRLTANESQWACAIVCHSNLFHSTVFPVVYPENKGKRFNDSMAAADYLVDHQIKSSMSFGVFDLDYQYRRPESAATEGKFWWDPKNDDATGEQLLQQMDFPLVSVALSYDANDPIDMARLADLIAAMPCYMDVYTTLHELDKRDPKSWEATGPRQVLMRNATSTRRDYEGKGLMGALARFLMREAKSLGYRGINIECLNDAVTHVWSEPPGSFKGNVVSEFNTWEYEGKNEAGANPFGTSRQRVTKVYTELL